ncbi:uncharacterized protein [Gossypium hirsutum]|uniref:Reverse transcriptase RNase H-like domain-containing protein n=1 Tax=Gossypium hirsutum TaxID=3635 RepID=A0ABM2ZBI6_GOSHI|nr:uncharacterized protein LOC107920518 [Gossypium hirsutum]
MDPDQAITDDVESNAPALAQRTVPEESRPVIKQGAEEFRANTEDDAERATFWLKNSIRVFDELSCTPEECLKCAISLLRNDAYHWWKTLISVVPKEAVNWDFFLEEFRKKRFEGGLNKDIRVLVGILELKDFVVLVEWACKAKELTREKKKAESKARDMQKRMMSRSTPTQSKKSKDVYSHERFHNTRESGSASKGRPPKSAATGAGSKNTTRETVVRFEARALVRAYGRRGREEASSPDVITGTAPTSITPYRMAPMELRELNSQLQQLVDKGFATLGEKCHVYTDHKSLKYLITENEFNLRQRRWLQMLKDYELIIDYQPGKAKMVFDVLSRKSLFALRTMSTQMTLYDDGSILAELKAKSTLLHQICEAQKSDEELQAKKV